MVDIAVPVTLKRRTLTVRRLVPVAMTLGLWALIIEGARLVIAAF